MKCVDKTIVKNHVVLLLLYNCHRLCLFIFIRLCNGVKSADDPRLSLEYELSTLLKMKTYALVFILVSAYFSFYSIIIRLVDILRRYKGAQCLYEKCSLATNLDDSSSGLAL